MVKQYWQDTEPIYLSTSSLFRFSKKLKGLKPHIRNLAKARMGNLVKKSREAYVDLCDKQKLLNPSQQHLELENEALRRWEFVAGLEESYLKQKSKLHWLKIGDQNNKTYLRAVEPREAVNCIKEIRCRDGTLTSEESEIKIEAESFFREFLQYQPEDYEGMEVDQLQQLLPFRCSETDSQQLLRSVTPEEKGSSLLCQIINPQVQMGIIQNSTNLHGNHQCRIYYRSTIFFCQRFVLTQRS